MSEERDLIMADIMMILEHISAVIIYEVTCKVLYDKKDEELPDSLENIKKARSICNTISNSIERNPKRSVCRLISSGQAHFFREFVANNLCVYGATKNEDDVRNLINQINKK